MLQEGSIISSSEEKILLDLDRQPAVPERPDMLEYVQDTLVVNRVMACKIYEYNTAQGLEQLWFSEEIPGGLVKSALDDSLTSELIDYEAKYSLDEGLYIMAEWAKKAGSRESKKFDDIEIRKNLPEGWM